MLEIKILGIVIPILIEIVFPLLIIYKLYKNFSVIRYYVKFTFFCIAVTLAASIGIPFYLIRPRNVLNLMYTSVVLQYVPRIMGIRFTVRGEEHLRQDRACVIVSNHQTSLDILGMFVIWPIARKLTVIARMLLLFAGPFGIGAWLCGVIYINKISADHGKKTMNDAMDEVKRKKIKIWVYAEGYRNHTGSMAEFKKGAFHMAIQAQVPIVPIVFSSYKHFMRKSEKVFDSGEVIIEALPSIPTEGLTISDVESLMMKVRECMIKKYNELNDEVSEKIKSK